MSTGASLKGRFWWRSRILSFSVVLTTDASSCSTRSLNWLTFFLSSTLKVFRREISSSWCLLLASIAESRLFKSNSSYLPLTSCTAVVESWCVAVVSTVSRTIKANLRREWMTICGCLIRFFIFRRKKEIAVFRCLSNSTFLKIMVIVKFLLTIANDKMYLVLPRLRFCLDFINMARSCLTRHWQPFRKH